MGDQGQSFYYPKGWDPALVRQIERTGAYRRPDKVKVPVYNRHFVDPEFREVLAEVTAFINERLRANGYAFTLHDAEVATNLLAEGADFAVPYGRYAVVSGFDSLGIDTFMEQYQQLKRWLPPRLIRVVEAGSVGDYIKAWSEGRFEVMDWKVEDISVRMAGRRPYAAGDRGSGLLAKEMTNEKGEAYYTLDFIDLELGMYASAAMLAQAMTTAFKDIGEPAFSTLGTEDRFFWGTMYYNSGPGTARKFLKKHGVEYSKKPFAGASSAAKKRRSSQYHAIKRMAAMGYLLRTVYADR